MHRAIRCRQVFISFPAEMVQNLKELFAFVESHIKDDPQALRLKYLKRREEYPYDISLAITQIKARRKTQRKLGGFLSENPQWLFPGSLQAEQASGEIIARFHSSLFSPEESVFDMTCGLGIDDYYISLKVRKLITCEINRDTAEIAEINFRNSRCDNVRVVCVDSLEKLESEATIYDTIFADPARRNNFGKRVFAFEECQPDIVKNFRLIKSRCNRLVIKASPMIDISLAASCLASLTDVYVVSVRNECRETLFICDFREGRALSPITLHAINLDEPDGPQIISGHLEGERHVEPMLEDYSEIKPGVWLGLPNASILKCGRTDWLAPLFGGKKLNANTHLYLFDTLPERFLGRVFRIEHVFSFHDRRLSSLKGQQFNIITRNFPLSPERLKQRLSTREGSDHDYLIGVSVGEGRRDKALIIKCRKI